MSYTNTSEPHGVIKRYFGELTSSDFIDSARDISVSEEFTQLRWIIADLLDVTSISVSEQAFEEVIVQQLGSYTTNRRIHFALVGSRSFIIDFFHHYIRIFHDVLGDKLVIKSFNSVKDAREWLENTR